MFSAVQSRNDECLNSRPRTPRRQRQRCNEVDRLMTDRAALERLLVEHQMMKEAIENSPVAFCIYDADDRLVAHNDRYVALYPDVDLTATGDDAVEPIHLSELVRSKLATHVPADRLDSAVLRHLADLEEADGTPVERDFGANGIYEVVKYRLPCGASGGMALDVTDTKAREAELNDARHAAVTSERAKTNFLANMSHELRTPLNAIMGFSELLQAQMDPHECPREQEYLGYVLESGHHLVSLINDLLDLSRIEAEAYTLSEGDVTISTALRSAHALLMPLAAKRGITFELSDIPPDLTVRADERALKQIVLNICTNALTYTPEGGMVTLGATIGDEHDVKIIASDNGCGIPEDELEAIEQPFVRGVSQVKAASAGAGLGLSITRKLTELHGGTLSLNSTAGIGTQVSVTLPAVRTKSIAGIALRS